MTVTDISEGGVTATPAADQLPWPRRLKGIGFGGDYNPEQWPMDVRVEDVELMKTAGVSIVSVGIFSWSTLEPRPGEYDFAWLDDILDRLHVAGIRVALATATASPPPWLTTLHPEILPVDHEGRTIWPGGRQAYSVSHPIWREYSERITRKLAQRYGGHPAVALWHIDNEIGCHVPHDYSDAAAAAFRVWLERRYNDIDSLNEAWGSRFWSQQYSRFDEVLPPRFNASTANPTQQLDFARFSSDSYLDYYRGLVRIVREFSPDVPVTTNFMATTRFSTLDYFAWSTEQDIISTDHYLDAADPESQIELAFSADLTRGIAGGRPWILMEHSTSAVNWQPRNRAKRPGEMLRNSLAHLARGADSIMFFQWRQSRSGSEKFHSALLPHSGTDSDAWRRTLALGSILGRLAEVRGSVVRSRIAIVFDYESWWASELDSHPSIDVRYLDAARAFHRELWMRGIPVDIVHPSADLDSYAVVIVPTLYLMTAENAQNLSTVPRSGAHLVVTYFSGIVDQDDAVILGGYPGSLRETLGVRVEEFAPLMDGEVVALTDGSSASIWTETMRLEGASAITSFADGDLAGGAAITRREVAGGGVAWYLATLPDETGLANFLDHLLGEAEIAPAYRLPRGVEVVVRSSDDADYVFVINHTDADAVIEVSGVELISGVSVTDPTVPAGESLVIRTTTKEVRRG